MYSIGSKLINLHEKGYGEIKGALFSLQARVIGVSVSQLLGADISMLAFRTENEQDEVGLPILTGLPELELNQVLNVTGNGTQNILFDLR